MEQKAFKEILNRYLAHSCTPEEKAIVEEWFAAIKPGEHDVLTAEEEDRLFAAYQRDFERVYQTKARPAISLRRDRNFWIRAAAAALIALAPVVYLLMPVHHIAEGIAVEDTGVRTIRNMRSSALLVALSDGSKVVLNPGSTVSFTPVFASGVREVSLEGEAFFDVAKDSLSPFVVKTSQLVTRVLGTSFTVKANKGGENIIVTVRTGRVAVQDTASDSVGEVLTPNQQAIYNIKARSLLRRELVAPPITPSGGPIHQERFREAPVAEIFQAMERIYGMQITFTPGDLKGCLLSTSIYKGEDIFKRLDIICMAIGATYKVDGVSIAISGESCDTASTDKTSPMGP